MSGDRNTEPAGIYDAPFLARNPANFAALTPLGFLARSALVYPDKLAVIDGERRFTYREFYARCRRFADALRRRGIGRGDTVVVMAPNVPALLEAHYGVPMVGAVLNALNYRLDASSIAFIMNHGGAKLLVADREFGAIVKPALQQLGRELPLIEIAEGDNGDPLGGREYEDFLGEGDPEAAWSPPYDEWSAITLNYTSGTTGNPKGVVFHHRGAYLNALGNAITFGLDRHSVYLWTLPMFHCNGWTYTWGVTAVSGTHVCLRRVDPAPIFALIAEHKVTHLCGAPIVLNMLVHAPDSAKRRFDHVVEVATGGSAPPSAVIEAMERMGFRVTHLYGLTESYGPSTVCAWQEEWGELPLSERAGKMARQGVQYLTLDKQRVTDPETLEDVPADGATIGELMLRGNTVMKGYLKNPAATDEAFAGGWFHTGDLAVMHPDGYAEIKDRSKDIIISGGENISSIEVEEVLYRHPQVMEAAVVAKPDEKWGETPCAFVTLKPDAGEATAADIIAFCRANLAHYKVPKAVVFGPLPKTSTGKIQKYALRDRAREVSCLPRASNVDSAAEMLELPSFDIAGQVALVTGASSGIGEHFAEVLAARGAKVALAARRADRLAELARRIEEAGGQCLPIACDVTKQASIAEAIAAAEAQLGPLSILVNNAGVVVSKPLFEHTEEDWDHVVDTNLKGAWLAAREFAHHLVEAKRPGRIINISSILASRTIGRVPAYCAAKAGLTHLTQVLAMELARYGILVNALAPGYVETDFNREYFQSEAGKRLISRIPLRRLGQAPDLDGALLFLASPASAYVTGAVIAVDGGHAVAAL